MVVGRGRSNAHYPLPGALLAGAVLVAAAALRRPPLARVEVVGDSMRPTLEPGDRLLVLAWGASRRSSPGRLVTVPDPRHPSRVLVKRVASRSPSGLVLTGDNVSASTDSRVVGPVEEARVRGRVVYRYLPEHRRGRL